MAKAKGKRGSAAQEMFGHLRSEGKPTKPTTTKAGDKHYAIPGLVRKRGSAARELYSYLRSGLAVLPGGAPFGKLLADAARGATSPLDGRAVPSKGPKRE